MDRALSLDDVVKQLRGAPGTTVTVSIERPLTGLVKDFTLTRAIIQMDMVKDINGRKKFPLGDDKIGYVRITEFGDKTSVELESALEKLQAQGMRALILDLRFNPGGLLDEAVDVCQKFLPRGQLIVSTEGRNLVEKHLARRATAMNCTACPSSCSSISAAPAPPKSSPAASRICTAPSSSAKKPSAKAPSRAFSRLPTARLKLTTAHYYTPSHKIIHERGITPDIFVPVSDAEEAVLFLKREPGGVESLDATDRATIEKIRDAQLARARDLLHGILLYGELSRPEKMAAK